MWVSVGKHLKPRHLFKLMLTCKSIKKSVDNEEYWTMVTSHCMFRDLPDVCEETLPDYDPENRKCGYNRYDMVTLDQGYYKAMSEFQKSIPELISKENYEEFDHYKNLPLKEVCVLHYKYVIGEDECTGNEETWSMKELLKRALEHQEFKPKHYVNPTLTIPSRITYGHMKSMANFVNWLDDDPMPNEHKKRIMRKLAALCKDLRIDVTPLGLETDSLFQHICRF